MGTRQTGKTTLLQAAYPDAVWVDLLKAADGRTRIEIMLSRFGRRSLMLCVADEAATTD